MIDSLKKCENKCNETTKINTSFVPNCAEATDMTRSVPAFCGITYAEKEDY